MTDLASIYRDMRRIADGLDEALRELRKRGETAAQLKTDHECALAKAYLEVEGATVKERESRALILCAEVALEARVAAALERSAQAAVRARQQQLSSLQSILSAHKAEAEFTRTSPPGVYPGGA